MKLIKLMIIMSAAWVVSACSSEAPSEVAKAAQGETQTILRETDFAQVTQGGKLFAKNCAECHGARGEGDPNWRARDAEGMLPAPPLNGTGHAWHHPQRMLQHVIKNGSPGGQGRMPAWKDRLSDEEITAIIAWFKSKWPDQVYAAWYQMNRKTETGS